jgi:hypothetical protein
MKATSSSLNGGKKAALMNPQKIPFQDAAPHVR